MFVASWNSIWALSLGKESVCVRISVHVCASECVGLGVFLYVGMSTCVHVDVGVSVCVCVRAQVCIFVFVRVCLYKPRCM